MPDFTRKLTVLSCLLFTGFCFWKAASGLIGGTDASVVPTAQAAMSPSFSHKRGITTPIQDMRPGMRIVGRNPNRLETESTIDPTPEGWRLLSIRMLKQDGSYFEAELLRPLSWISRHHAKPGATIQLNMPELHVVGAAEVLSISDCPPIDSGDGPVVISTFKNVSRNVLNIYVEGEETPIGVTAGHPIWSEDRQAFVHSEKLQPGEKLRSALGRTVRITSIEPRAGPETVYNLEVAGEHVYSVTGAGLLVHNTGPCDFDARVFNASERFGRRLTEKGLENAQDFLARSLQRGILNVDEAVAVLRLNNQFRTAKVAQRVYRKALTSTDTMVIGSLPDTGIAARWSGYRVLTMRNREWNLITNAAWVRGGIDRNAKFYLASPINEATTVHAIYGRTVFAREIEQLNISGYQQVGDNFIKGQR